MNNGKSIRANKIGGGMASDFRTTLTLLFSTVWSNYSLTEGAEPYLRSHQFCFMEHECSLPCSKEHLLVPVLSQITLVHNVPSYLSKIHFNIFHDPTSWSSLWSLSLWLSHQYPICTSPFPHSCYIHCPSHPPWLDHSNYTWRRVQVMKLLIMQCSPTSCHFISFRYKHSPYRLNYFLKIPRQKVK
jgi:hypothetical protein